MSRRPSERLRTSPKSSTSSPSTSASKFELIAELGRGGMATVYLARAQHRLDKLIVLKRLRSDLAENAEFLAMFLEEARLAGKLHHPNIVETYEVGQDENHYYIAMEYLDGLSLQAVLTKFGWTGKFSFPLHVYVLIQALCALEHAYTQRDDDGTPLHIVHRDVSPPNIIITFDGQVKLVDFGIAKAANSNVETRTGLIKGKLTYMAPEQAASGDVDSRTDIYSVGVMLWQVAAGMRRWKGVENTEVLRRLHAGKVTDSPHAEKRNLPESVNTIVLKAIASEPEDRYRSASELRVALQRLLAEMNATVSSADLSEFMSDAFGDARARAREVIRDRLAALEGVPISHEKESLTAIRSSVQRSLVLPEKVRPSAPESEERVADKQAQNKNQVGGAAASLSEKIRREGSTRARAAKTPTTTAAATATAATKISATARRERRSHAIPIAIVGLGLSAALGVVAFKMKTPAASSNTPPPAIVGVSQNAPPASSAEIPAASAGTGATSVPLATASASSDVVNIPQPFSSSHRRHVDAPKPRPVVVPRTATTSSEQTPISASPPPVAPIAAPSENNSPSLDKRDPWTRTPNNRADPWAPGSAAAQSRPDPWAK